MKANRKLKDSVFTALFENPDLLRDLYCALEGVSLPPDVPVSINTLENVLYMDLYNDISFEIGGKLVVLIEHQSTINPNMALRLLFYITRLLEKRVKNRTLYSKKNLSIPWPEFFVLYNGTDPYPDSSILRLSDLFERPQDLGLPGKSHPLLELEVKFFNINRGKNAAIVSRCKELADYSEFVAKTRSFFKELDNNEEAIKEAVKYCQKHGILYEFLKTHGSEVFNMILEEWNIDDAREVWREEAREEGLEEGLEKGHKKGHKEGLEEGHKEGQEIAILNIARNALAEGATPEFVQKITGLDPEAIKAISYDT